MKSERKSNWVTGSLTYTTQLQQHRSSHFPQIQSHIDQHPRASHGRLPGQSLNKIDVVCGVLIS